MNSRKLTYFAITIMLLTQGCGIHAAEQVFHCPPEISVAWNILSPPTGWEVSGNREGQKSAHFLVSLTFSDGHPDDGAFLRPASIRELNTKGKGETIEQYNFSDRVNNTIWLVCMYGNTPAILSKTIPQKIQSCEVSRPKDLQHQKAHCQ